MKHLLSILIPAAILFAGSLHASETPAPPPVSDSAAENLKRWTLVPSIGGWVLTTGLDMAVGESFGASFSKRFESAPAISYGGSIGVYSGVSGLLNLALVYPLFLGGTISSVTMVPVLGTITFHTTRGTVRPAASIGLGLVDIALSGTDSSGNQKSSNSLNVAGTGSVGIELWFWEGAAITWDIARIGFFGNRFLGETAFGVAFLL